MVLARLDPEPIAAATDLLWEWIDTTVGAEAPLLVVGFSQGGLMGTQLLRTRPERVRSRLTIISTTSSPMYRPSRSGMWPLTAIPPLSSPPTSTSPSMISGPTYLKPMGVVTTRRP